MSLNRFGLALALVVLVLCGLAPAGGRDTGSPYSSAIFVKGNPNGGVKGLKGQLGVDSVSGSLYQNTTGQKVWALISTVGGGGDITAVTAGAGLTGGGASGAVTVTVGAGANMVANADDVALNPVLTGITSMTAAADLDVVAAGADGDVTVTATGTGTISLVGAVSTSSTFSAGGTVTASTGNVAATAGNVIAGGANSGHFWGTQGEGLQTFGGTTYLDFDGVLTMRAIDNSLATVAEVTTTGVAITGAVSVSGNAFVGDNTADNHTVTGHLAVLGTTPTLNDCTGATITGSDNGFHVEIAEDAICNVTFSRTFTNTPVCVIQIQGASGTNVVNVSSISATSLAWTSATTDPIDVICLGKQAL
jgi:hypothetical protein